MTRRGGGEALPVLAVATPRSWREVYTVIIGLLVGFLGLAFLADWVKQVLGRWL